jgi:acetylornithine deacetylase
MYELAGVPGLAEHPAYMAGRRYEGRPNVVGRFAAGGGRSLLFSSHIDTVYVGQEKWEHPPFSGEVADGRLYGRGAYDMKGGLAASMMAVKCLRELGIPLGGDVYIESVVDEEYGGANGSLAARLHGPNADMAIIPEPSNLRAYTAHLGGGMWKATFHGRSGIAFNGEPLVSALVAAADFVRLVGEYAAERLHHAPIPEPWVGVNKRAEAAVLSFHSGDHERYMQEKVPALATVTFWIEGYPGQQGEEVLGDFEQYIKSRSADYPSIARCRYEFAPLIRYLGASEMRPGPNREAFVRTVMEAGGRVLGQQAEAPCGAPFACDGFMFNLHSTTPALILGPSGGNAHAPDEFLDLASYMKLIRWYAIGAVG